MKIKGLGVETLEVQPNRSGGPGLVVVDENGKQIAWFYDQTGEGREKKLAELFVETINDPFVMGCPAAIVLIKGLFDYLMLRSPGTLEKLIEYRVSCSYAVDAHPYFTTATGEHGEPVLGLLGIMNSLVAPHAKFVAHYDDKTGELKDVVLELSKDSNLKVIKDEQ